LYPFVTQGFRSPPPHAVAEDSLAVAESFHNRRVAIRAMLVSLIAPAFALGMSCESVGPQLPADDLSIFDIENEKM
jgi:hypothetical protein